jgi:hypothetical protein
VLAEGRVGILTECGTLGTMWLIPGDDPQAGDASAQVGSGFGTDCKTTVGRFAR